jgi:ubiquinone biosynthesis protein COQ9
MCHYDFAFYAKNPVAISIYMSSSVNPYRSVKISSFQQSTAMNAAHIESFASPQTAINTACEIFLIDYFLHS